MKLISWNVNSIRTRMERISALIERESPDVLCLQETKVRDEDFPCQPFDERGYRCFFHGQKSYNGVATLIRKDTAAALEDDQAGESAGVTRETVKRGFPGDPIFEQSRVLSVKLGKLNLVNVYVVNGKAVGHEYYDLKLRWLKALTDWIAEAYDPSDELIICGDFNIAPEDRDVHDPERWQGRVLCSEPERLRLSELLGWGLLDLHRVFTQDEDLFTWWDYRQGAFHRGWGLRIDLFLGTKPVATRVKSVKVDRDERKKTSGPGKPSDHAPVIVSIG